MSQVQKPIRFCCALLLVSSLCWAADNQVTRKSLRGLSGVNVLVEPLSAQAKQDGLNEVDIQKDVELKLRLAGIRVLTEKESLDTPGGPYLYVLASDVLTGGIYAVSIRVGLCQSVYLERDPSSFIAGAETWSIQSVATIGRNKLAELRDSIKDDVDTFLNAYLSVNPKK